MAVHNYNANRSKTATAVANDEDRFAFAGGGYEAYEVTNQSTTSALWFRADGIAAAVDGDDCTYVGPGDSVTRVLDARSSVVSVMSNGTPKYIVEGVK